MEVLLLHLAAFLEREMFMRIKSHSALSGVISGHYNVFPDSISGIKCMCEMQRR